MSEAAFNAHLIGQEAGRRGLRGGPETLERARTTYLKAEFSGGAERRAPKGRSTKTDI